MTSRLARLFQAASSRGPQPAPVHDAEDGPAWRTASLGQAIDEQRSHLETWLQRHQRIAPATGKRSAQREGLSAMVEIASDPRRLLGASRQEARRLSLAAAAAMETMKTQDGDPGTQAALREVASRIEEWRAQEQYLGNTARAPAVAAPAACA